MSDVIPPPEPHAAHSPFRPGFGSTPPALVGRQAYINAFARSVDGPPGTPGRAVFVTGQRGMGKTVLLNVFEDVALSRQWLTVREQASPGFATRLTNARIPEVLEAHDAHINVSATTVGFSLPITGGGLTRRTESTSALVPDFRSHLMKALELLDQHNTGLLISLDEVHRSNLDEFRTITDAMAYAFSQDAPLSVVVAGLPWSINDIVNDDVSTFLRRADRIVLTNLTAEHSAMALREPIEEFGKSIDSDALDLAVRAGSGYPYLVQVIGHLAWVESGSDSRVTYTHVAAVIEEATSVLAQQIHEPTLAALTPGQLVYVQTMSELAGSGAESGQVSTGAVSTGKLSGGAPVSTGKVATALNLSKQAANNVRKQLIDLGVIASPGRGLVDFTIPYMREFLQG